MFQIVTLLVPLFDLIFGCLSVCLLQEGDTALVRAMLHCGLIGDFMAKVLLAHPGIDVNTQGQVGNLRSVCLCMYALRNDMYLLSCVCAFLFRMGGRP